VCGTGECRARTGALRRTETRDRPSPVGKSRLGRRIPRNGPNTRFAETAWWTKPESRGLPHVGVGGVDRPKWSTRLTAERTLNPARRTRKTRLTLAIRELSSGADQWSWRLWSWRREWFAFFNYVGGDDLRALRTGLGVVNGASWHLIALASLNRLFRLSFDHQHHLAL
jgi:hypothetical protein